MPFQLAQPLAVDRPEKVPSRPKARLKYVLPSEDLEPIRHRGSPSCSRRQSEDAGVPVIQLHDRRQACVTFALELGADPKVVQQLLGPHS